MSGTAEVTNDESTEAKPKGSTQERTTGDQQAEDAERARMHTGSTMQRHMIVAVRSRRE